ncbi:hypothetical protein [Pantoea latae]|uniref:hypothetical protein n=1 Tax=Pantoea latae TaxID=1964541 RepID=UPI001F456FAC|nr:hypothetical protein [Pantoea latae]
MKWIFLSGILFSVVAVADDRSFEPPEVRCLNDHTIPLIKTTIPAKKLVDDAWVQCKPELDEWMKLQESLPEEMKQNMRRQLYDFYIRMIEKRRQFEARQPA